MADYKTATLDHSQFQKNSPAGWSWRKRYTKENGGEWVNDGTWKWSGGVVKTAKPAVVKPVVSRKFD